MLIGDTHHMSWGSKFVCVIVFLTSLALVLAMGKSNVTNFTNINNSVTEIYEDRLVVNAIIYKLAVMLHQKELALVTQNNAFFVDTNNDNNQQAKTFINQVKNTHLTETEAVTLDHFEKGFEALMTIEQAYVTGTPPGSQDDIVPRMSVNIGELKAYLDELSDIQLSEGKTQFVKSKKAVESMTLFDSLENYFLIITSILVFVVIFLPSSRKTK